MFCKEEIAKLLPKTQQAIIPLNVLKLLFEEYLLDKISLYNLKLKQAIVMNRVLISF